jgi:hypothetical protein
LNEKDEPMRIEKANTNLEKAVQHQRSEHEDEDTKISKHEGQIKSHKDKHEQLSNKFEELNKVKYEKGAESK